MGRPVQQRQGAAQRQGAERRRILVSSFGVNSQKCTFFQLPPCYLVYIIMSRTQFVCLYIERVRASC